MLFVDVALEVGCLRKIGVAVWPRTCPAFCRNTVSRIAGKLRMMGANMAKHIFSLVKHCSAYDTAAGPRKPVTGGTYDRWRHMVLFDMFAIRKLEMQSKCGGSYWSSVGLGNQSPQPSHSQGTCPW